MFSVCSKALLGLAKYPPRKVVRFSGVTLKWIKVTCKSYTIASIVTAKLDAFFRLEINLGKPVDGKLSQVGLFYCVFANFTVSCLYFDSEHAPVNNNTTHIIFA